MFRKYMRNLVDWINDKSRKPLLVWGARQVGKTYLIKDMFAEEYFKNNYIYIDCRTEHDFVKYCNTHINAKEIINYLSLDKGMEINKDTLLIFDEAQECLPIVTLMKYFCQDYREIPVIVTGSMVRIKIQREDRKRGNGSQYKFLFPVGKINQLVIYPMNFEEFLYNTNKLLYDKVLNSYKNKIEIEEAIHEKIIDIFYDYLLLGGMPEVVKEFLETKSYQKAREIIYDLYDNYLGDMQLYQASPEAIVRSKRVFDSIYNQLNKENKNFKASIVEKNAKTRELRSPIDWLSLAFLVHKSSLIKERVTPPLINSDESVYRLYLSDMGIFTYQSGVNARNFLYDDGRNSLSGVYFENYVAIELINQGYKLFYWKGKGESEFEFLIEDDQDIIPIDVKKKKGSLNSLVKYTEHNKLKYAIKISGNKYGYNEENKILTLPFYYLGFYLTELNEKKKIF